ncbi:hypothetical protein NMY3_03025 [Candidatus Nitrosocosmicus oleophilus]|uniref:DUF3631 domain-containing protein n=1 Tax=Candidatus Nitrosocosmicus oleophilus TaxID=1353260 RepID=A0A654MCL4_9ARCH|nr:hypothetical protein [Candidatus Nitrosocosmicus oleophilus]ALI37212.1 hypothetical protein NMY3_03025 [Candidatus Nitrosocosmicus oleophilus]
MSEILKDLVKEDIDDDKNLEEYENPNVVFRAPLIDSSLEKTLTTMFITTESELCIVDNKGNKFRSKIVWYKNQSDEIKVDWSKTGEDIRVTIRNSGASGINTEKLLAVLKKIEEPIELFMSAISNKIGLDSVVDYICTPKISEMAITRFGESDDQLNNYGKTDPKREFSTYKYTVNNQIYEAVLIEGLPYFITINGKGQLEIVDKIVEETRILKPPFKEDYIYQPIAFESIEELESYIETARHLTFDDLFRKIRKYVSRFIVHHEHVLDYISALIIFTYFQDKFPTVPYTMFVSDNGSGKSTIGDMFEVIAYRCVNMTDPTTANVYRILGNIETGQCTLVFDEVDKIDQSDMMSVIKSGYEKNKIITRTNTNSGKQEHFHAYGVKVMLGERTPDPSRAKGVLDRTFIISNFKGKPELDIKEIKNPENKVHIRTAKELDTIRKTLMAYRLIHFNDEIINIETGLEGRDKELSKPILQRFYGTKCLQDIENALEKLLNEKHDRKAHSLERDALEVIVKLFEEYQDGVIPFSEIWYSMEVKTNGHINEYKRHQLETEVHGTLYKTSFSKMLRDKFGAKDPSTREANTRSLAFDIDKTMKYLESYTKENGPTQIECSLVKSDSSDSSDSSSECSVEKFWDSGSSTKDYRHEAEKIMADMGLI